MDGLTDSPSASAPLRLRPERDGDRDFRFELFCASRPPEWQMAAFEPTLFRHVMLQQFHAQTVSYRTQFPQARFEIIELDGEPVGRIVVDRPAGSIHVVDLAVLPAFRGRGIGTGVLEALIDEARRCGIPVRLNVASGNDPSLRLYLRLGFEVVDKTEMYLGMQWRDKPTPVAN